MDVEVDLSRCSGHARCWAACPEVFDVHEITGRAIVLMTSVPPELEASVREAEADCPELAVIIKP